MDNCQTIALFGGTFDPVHLGHINTVAALQKDLNIDQIRWVLSAHPPHRHLPEASIEQRLTMLNIALTDYPGMVSDDVEVRREKASYTIDTLIYFREKYPKASLTLIVGSDIMDSFDRWHRADDILRYANIIVMHRAGYDNHVHPMLLESVVKDWKILRKSAFGCVFMYAAPPIPISATKIRQSIANGDDASQFLDEQINRYIQTQQLYLSSPNMGLKTESNQTKLTENQEDTMIENHAQADFSAETVLLNSDQQVEMIVDALEDNKALDIKVLDIADIASFADYMIIATGTSSTHLKSIAANASRELSRQGLKSIGEEGRDSNEWVLADFGDVVVHIMRQEVRELYDLEKLWDREVRKVLAESNHDN